MTTPNITNKRRHSLPSIDSAGFTSPGKIKRRNQKSSKVSLIKPTAGDPNSVVGVPFIIRPKPSQQLTTTQKIMRCFERAREWFDQSWFGKMYYRYDPLRPFGMYAYNFLSNTYNIGSFNSLFNIANLREDLRAAWSDYSLLEKLKHVGKILFILSIPVALYGLGIAIRDFIHTEDRWNCLLRMGENLSWFASSAGSLTFGLFTVGVGSLSLLMWAFAFYTAGVLLGVATPILNLRELMKAIDSRDFLTKQGDLEAVKKDLKENKEIKAELVWKKSSYIWELIFQKPKRENWLAKTANVSLDTAKTFFIAVRIRSDKELACKEAIERLTKRLNQQVFLGKLAVIGSTISFIGTLILLFTPLFPVAYGLLAFSGAISMYRFYHNHKSLGEFYQKPIAGYKIPP